MLPSEALSLANDLLKQYYLDEWRVEFDLHPRIFGRCYNNKRKIVLSKLLVTFNSVDTVRDTILHEIAHALVGWKAGHEPLWKHCASRIGATPKACYSLDNVNQKFNGDLNVVRSRCCDL